MSEKEPLPEFTRVWEALDELAKSKKCISFDFKIRFLDKASLQYQYRNPEHAPRKRSKS
jgi:hypothetical protein